MSDMIEAAKGAVFDYEAAKYGDCVHRWADLPEDYRLSLSTPAFVPVLIAAVRPHIEAKALREAADAIQALHPGEVKASVLWLRDRADRIESGAS